MQFSSRAIQATYVRNKGSRVLWMKASTKTITVRTPIRTEHRTAWIVLDNCYANEIWAQLPDHKQAVSRYVTSFFLDLMGL